MNNLRSHTTEGWAEVEDKKKPSVLLQDVKREIFSSVGDSSLDKAV